MVHHFRRPLLKTLLLLRKSALQPILVRWSANCHNWSYHTLSFFAQNGETHPKHTIQQYQRFFLKHILPTDNVLDVGCGSGEVTYAVSQKANKVMGIDFSASSITHARRKFHHPSLSFVVGDAVSLTPSDAWDVIILSNVLEHIDDRITFLRKLSRLAPRLLIRVPMLTRDWVTVYKKNQGLEYRLDDTHRIEYDNQSFSQEIEAADCSIESSYVEFGELYAVIRTSAKLLPHTHE